MICPYQATAEYHHPLCVHIGAIGRLHVGVVCIRELRYEDSLFVTRDRSTDAGGVAWLCYGNQCLQRRCHDVYRTSAGLRHIDGVAKKLLFFEAGEIERFLLGGDWQLGGDAGLSGAGFRKREVQRLRLQLLFHVFCLHDDFKIFG